MWVMKLKVESKNQFLGRLAIKHRVSMTGYPLSYYKDAQWLYLITCGFFFGKEKNKKNLAKDIKKQPELVEGAFERLNRILQQVQDADITGDRILPLCTRFWCGGHSSRRTTPFCQA